MILPTLHTDDIRMESCVAKDQERRDGQKSTDRDDAENVTIQQRIIRKRNNSSSFFHISTSILAFILLSSYLPLAMPSTSVDNSQTGATEQQQQSDDSILNSDKSPFRI
eukprot:scaffold7116_cov139-Skeletonema_dohrnii-CCMP3373.AAC.4